LDVTREMIQARVDIEPDSPPIRHFHPGDVAIPDLRADNNDVKIRSGAGPVQVITLRRPAYPALSLGRAVLV
jgi:hypothetical protein